ncbi:MAG: TetR/AcrR family transcriptional regulator [Promethearchaeota archaeon]|jgi:AcrR family transcriptional regulator
MKNSEEKTVVNLEQKFSKKQRKIIRTKKIILDAAESLFNENKYEEVRIDDIAEKSALSKATIYNYFHSKEGIYYSIGVRAFLMINNITRERLASTASGLEILEELIRANMKGRKDYRLYNEITNRFLLIDHNLTKKIVNISRKRKAKRLAEDGNELGVTNIVLADYLDQLRIFTDFWSQIIRKGVEDGTIKPNRDINEIAEFIFIAINGIVQLMSSNHLFHEEVALSEERAYELTVLFIKKFLGDPDQT